MHYYKVGLYYIKNGTQTKIPYQGRARPKMAITIIITTAATLAAVYLAYRLHKKSKDLESQLKKSTFSLKSSYIKFGKTFEQFAPFTKNFTQEEKNNFIFLGCPIDGVIFGEDKIKFIEIKTGESQLSGKQKRIRKMIETGRVEFMEVRYNDN